MSHHSHPMRRCALAAMTLVMLTACIKPNTFNGENAPERSELDRLQKIVNDRPDLEVAQKQLIDLDVQIRATIAAHAPQTVLPPSPPDTSRGCSDPFTHNIGDTYTVDDTYGRPPPNPQQWQDITTALAPIFTAAGFHPNYPAGQTPPPGDVSRIRDDGALINLNSAPGLAVLSYSYTTGCRLPAAWRTGPPPEFLRGNDPNAHYPYLFGSPGGRTASP
jgi:hypothetical protein